MLHGNDVQWSYIPGSHYVLKWIDQEINIRGSQKPTVREMTIAVEAHRQGYIQGQTIGRLNLQNDLKVLLSIT